jgi:hypothetical protein
MQKTSRTPFAAVMSKLRRLERFVLTYMPIARMISLVPSQTKSPM